MLLMLNILYEFMDYNNDDLLPDDNDLADIIQNTDIKPVPSGSSKAEDKESDYDLVRNALREVLVSTQESIKEAIGLANAADDSKGYSALAQLINSFSNISDKLIDIHKETSKPERSKSNQTDQNAIPGTTNIDKQIVFNGDPAEILRRLKDNNEDDLI